MEADLKAANDALIKLRRERLRDLYASEKAHWQTLLAQQGLTMETGEI